MANLIITVISIALVAVAALIGAYYGGQAFTDGQVKATANQIIVQGDQIAAAWRAYALDQGGGVSLAPDSEVGWSAGTSVLVPKYLTSLPKVETDLLETSVWVNKKGWMPRKLSSWSADYTASDGLGIVLANTEAARAICREIAKRAHGDSGTPTICTPVPAGTNCNTQNLTPVGNYFDCTYEDKDGSGTFNAGDNALILYRVF